MRKWALLALVVLLLAALWAGCQQNAVAVPVRSLERSSRAAFLCIRNPTDPSPGIQMRGCAAVSTTLDPFDYATGPHTIALVTQEARGEVAVVDVTAGGVVDVDATHPGANFLPVGGLPTDVVATPGSTAAFVSTGDPLRPGIFGLAAYRLYLPYESKVPAPSLAVYPACSLPAVATQLLVVPDRSGVSAGVPRAHCPNAVLPPDMSNGGLMPGYDLANETAVFGALKVVALMPDLAELAVIDAQALLARAPGSFDACPIEKMLVLPSEPASPGESDAAPPPSPDSSVAVPDAGSDVGACTAPPPLVIAPAPLPPHPVAMAYADDGRLFVSDDNASVIHVVDLSDPCAPVVGSPLLPTSVLEPSRAVRAGALAVSPLLDDMSRFVYAVDVKNNGSVMVFDVSAGATQKTPLLRPDLLSNSREPPDRIAFNSPVVGVTFARHDVVTMLPLGDPQSVVERAVRCEPTMPTDKNIYEPDFTGGGAGPHRLRGVFGFLAFSDGRLAVIDLDDFDGPCRRPKLKSNDVRLGCSGHPLMDPLDPLDPPAEYYSASEEASCIIVERNRPRSNQYFTNSVPTVGQHAPAMQGFPLLYDKDHTALGIDPTRDETKQRPKMLTPSLEGSDFETQKILVAVTGLTPSASDLPTWWNPSLTEQHSVAFDLREPRAHVAQGWSVIYEGIFAQGAAGRLQCADPNRTANDCERLDPPSHFELFDSSIGFCNAGVEGQDLAAVQNIPQGDVIEITSELPDPDDPYWSSVIGVCSRQSCETSFGTKDNPRTAQDFSFGGRDFVVDRSFQDHLVLAQNPNRDRGSVDGPAPITCCFPYPVSYNVRGGKHWIVTGTVSGFAHHVVPDPSLPDPSIGACVLSCDPTLSLRNSRVVGLPQPADPTAPGAIPSFDDPRVFRNSQLRFVVWNPLAVLCGGVGAEADVDAGDAGDAGLARTLPCVQRGMIFSFFESGGFEPMVLTLSSSALVLPRSVSFVPGLEQLAIVDAVSQGLMLFDLNRLGVVQTLF